MWTLLRMMSFKLVTDSAAAKAAPAICFSTALIILICGFVALGRLPLTATELLFGLLLVVGVAMNAVILGMLVPIADYIRRHDKL